MKTVERADRFQLVFGAKGMRSKEDCSNLKGFLEKIADYGAQGKRLRTAEQKTCGMGTRTK